MKLTFVGAAHEVTGSCHFLQTAGKNILIDCGMEQGPDLYENPGLPIPANEVDYVFLTHAHIDHSGMLPRLAKDGFKGQIFTTYATADLCNIMLRDSAHIQEFEAEWRNRKGKRAGQPEYEPVYVMQDALDAIELLVPCQYGERIRICEGVEIRFTDVGHLLGSASIEVWATEDGVTKKIVFSGDIGNTDQPIIKDPAYTENADYIVMESTYGNRVHAQEKPDYEFSASIGISQYGKDGTDYETLFKIADGALYIAKEKGKDRFIVYDKEKHGHLLTEDGYCHKKTAGVDFMRPIDKVELSTNLMLKVFNGGMDVAEEVLMELMDKMNIHGMTIYKAPSMECRKTLGHYEKEPGTQLCLSEEKYLARFDEHHIHVINNTASIAVEYPQVYEHFKQNNIGSALQFSCMLNGQLWAVFEFDIFGANRRKWCQDDISAIYSVVKAIADVYKKFYEQK